ncbi:hypothetical protein [Novosphingobium sp. FSW06-99]|uniref:hypothetical protein n=1 Tax=Novosphingobium sp. FSW06-99 TaxID=1739113 RepID=UPI00076DE3DB|nr:hypothetical protein [Novosphingobium sp. FSW06-99]KUR80132.1 hypothetical protein AQZ49_03305 [Novosphingobium sp. FSW06-99]
MEISGPLSPIAGFVYIATSGLALVAATCTPATRRKLAVINWGAVAVIFVALAVWRLTDGEILLQDYVRGWTRGHGVYDDRHVFQVPVTLGAVLVMAALVVLAQRSSGVGRSGQALALSLVMVVYTAVRATSLHAIDEILYQSLGPIHVNYLIDLGLTALVAALAIFECRQVATSASRRHRSSSSRTRRSRSADRDPDRPRRRRRQ